MPWNCGLHSSIPSRIFWLETVVNRRPCNKDFAPETANASWIFKVSWKAHVTMPKYFTSASFSGHMFRLRDTDEKRSFIRSKFFTEMSLKSTFLVLQIFLVLPGLEFNDDSNLIVGRYFLIWSSSDYYICLILKRNKRQSFSQASYSFNPTDCRPGVIVGQLSAPGTTYYTIDRYVSVNNTLFA